MIWTVTGGLGFIGSHFLELLDRNGEQYHLIDKQTYASNPIESLRLRTECNLLSARYEDICDLVSLPKSDILVNFAAETHVDRSINESRSFLRSNVTGLHNIVDLARTIPRDIRPLIVQISTDEVFGDAVIAGRPGEIRKFGHGDRLSPRNPYAASKAAAEHVISSFHTTYDVDYVLIRMTNNYGIRQYPEKLIPSTINRIINGSPIIVHGMGKQLRDWLHVSDCVQAIYSFSTQAFREHELRNRSFHVAGHNPVSVNDVVGQIREIMAGLGFGSEVQYVADRYCQDEAYGLKSDWQLSPRDLRADLEAIVDWCVPRMRNQFALKDAA